MTSKTSIVTSAASCGKPQPIRSMGKSHSSNAEPKESNMVTSVFSTVRGFSLVAAAVAAVGLGAATPAGAAVVRTPIGFTFSSSASQHIADVVVENTATAGPSGSVYTSYVTANVDGTGGTVLYEAGLAGAPSNTGLPVGGSFSSLMNTAADQTTFQFLPYTAANAFITADTTTTGTMTLNTAASYTSLAIMALGANGSSVPQVTLKFTNGDTVVTDFTAADWFTGSSGTTPDGNTYGVALQGFNRVGSGSGTFDTAYTNNHPDLYQTDLNLTDLTGSLNGGSLTSNLNLSGYELQSVTAQSNSTSQVVVFGISGAAAVPEPSSAMLLLAGLGGLAMLARRRARCQMN